MTLKGWSESRIQQERFVRFWRQTFEIEVSGGGILAAILLEGGNGVLPFLREKISHTI
jgi:hypothetical protein